MKRITNWIAHIRSWIIHKRIKRNLAEYKNLYRKNENRIQEIEELLMIDKKE